MSNYRLSMAPRGVRLVLTLFLIVMGIGYLMGVLNIYDKTHFAYDGVVKSYQGSEEEMIYGKEFGDMVSVSHSHLGGWAMMFILVLAVFFFTSYGMKLKVTLGVMPFLFMIFDVGSMWLTRYVAPGFAVFLMLFGFLLASTFGLLVVLGLADMWLCKPARTG